MKLKNILMALAVTLAGVGMVGVPMDAEAKRLGGGRASGMQRQMPAKQPNAAPDAAPNQMNKSAAPTNATKMLIKAGPPTRMASPILLGIAGLAAGLGIAALMSHLGMGEAFGNFLMMALLAVAAVALIAFLMRRFKGGAQQARGPQLAGAGAPYGQQFNQADSRDAFAQPMQRQGFDAATAAVGAAATGAAVAGNLSNVPAGFDAEGFQRIAKMIFIRLQAANDAGNLDDLRAQLAALVHPGFLLETPADALAQLPRYVKAMRLRAERAVRDPARYQARMLEIKPFADALAQAVEDGVAGSADWQALRWDLEELRVSMFAQELGARAGVSPKKLAQRLQALRG